MFFLSASTLVGAIVASADPMPLDIPSPPAPLVAVAAPGDAAAPLLIPIPSVDMQPVQVPKAEPKKADPPKIEPKKVEPKAAVAPPVAPAPAMLPTVTVPVAPSGPVACPTVACADPAPKTRVYGDFDVLLWSFKRDNAPPLVTAGPFASQGVIGRPGTAGLFEGRYSEGLHTGFRGTVGGWLADDSAVGVEGSILYFVPRQRESAFFGGATAGRALAVPFFDRTPGGGAGGLAPFLGLIGGGGASTVGPNGERAYLIGQAGTAGQAVVTVGSKLWGAEANAVYALGRSDTWAVTALAGFRYLDLKEQLDLSTRQIFPGTLALVGGAAFSDQLATTTYDHFATHNQFYGGQVGAKARGTFGRFTVSGTAKVGLGFTRETTNVDGGYTSPVPLAFGFFGAGPGGLLTAPNTNIGQHYRNHFSVVPEAAGTVAYAVSDRLSLSAGYDFLYWSGVARPGIEIDRAVNLNNIGPLPGATRAGPAVPGYPERSTGFYAHGVNLGVSLKY